MKQKVWVLAVIAGLLVLGLVIGLLMLDKKPPEAPALITNIPEYSGEAFVVLKDNEPDFSEKDLKAKSYEYYSELDQLGRCGYAMACVGRELMPTEERESISHIKPSGWVQAQYDIVDGKNLYNRCHLIGFQLTGENANERNLITGTRYMNVEGMLPFENLVADYVRETGNHVLYRVTPVYDGNNLVAKGVRLEAKSIEDDGEGVCFHVFVYNCQPGVTIDYADGTSKETADAQNPNDSTEVIKRFVLNKKSKKFHTETCSQGKGISEENKENYEGTREELINDGYVPAGCCEP